MRETQIDGGDRATMADDRRHAGAQRNRDVVTFRTVYDVAIIGAGATGVLLALQLSRQGGDRLRIAVIERSGVFGRGVAYATRHPAHLLNTRAADMSAWPDEPAHFFDWLARRSPASAGEFAPRWLYGDYLGEQFAEALLGGRIELVIGEAIAIRPGARVQRLALDGGVHLDAARVVLATGHSPPSADEGPWRGDPWAAAERLRDELHPQDEVLLVGTGLTAVDLVACLLENGHRGRIVALSRRGLLPRAHGGGTGGRADISGLLHGPLSRRLARFRALQRGGAAWQDLMQALRPRNSEIWLGLADEQRQRFLRHLRPWWDVHRHRMPPATAEIIARGLASGQFEVRAGRIEAISYDEAGARLSLVGRRGTTAGTARFKRVVDCRGSVCTVTPMSRLLCRLAEDGLIRSDPFGLGLSLDGDGAVVNAAGQASRHLFALGPPARGMLGESTAIPDIRQQAAALAAHLLRQHDSISAKSGSYGKT